VCEPFIVVHKMNTSCVHAIFMYEKCRRENLPHNIQKICHVQERKLEQCLIENERRHYKHTGVHINDTRKDRGTTHQHRR
jgi:hypothetical protein